MAKTQDQNAKKLHLHYEGANSDLTFCGRVITYHGPFNNPEAKLCTRCERVGLATRGMDSVRIEMRDVFGGNQWVPVATPPKYALKRRWIIDRNDPSADPVYITDAFIEVLLFDKLDDVRAVLVAEREERRAKTEVSTN